MSRPAAEPPGTPIFRISAVRPLALDVNDVRFADIEPAKANGYFVEDDLLFTRYSGNPDYVGASLSCLDPLFTRTSSFVPWSTDPSPNPASSRSR